MKTLGNLLWLVFGGIIIAFEYFVAGILLMITIIGIPFGIQAMKMGILAFWPFGYQVRDNQQSSGCLNLFFNILWLFVGGIWICVTHIALGVLLFITIIGIPFGKQHFKLAALSLTPFGKEIISE